jgi:hypothetical protein
MVPFSRECVYDKLSDMNNLGVLRDKLDDPANAERLRQQMTEEQISQAKERLKDMKFDRDSVSANVPPIGNISLRIINREAPKCVKFEAVGSPVPVNLWIQLAAVDENTCKMKVTVRTELNMMMKMMIGNKLQAGVDKLADVLAQVPYGA